MSQLFQTVSTSLPKRATRRRSSRQSVLLLAFWFCLSAVSELKLLAQQASHGVAAANLVVVQKDTANTTNSVLVTTSLSINQFSVRDGSNRGDVNVQIGSGFSDDVDTGVLLASVAENGRDNGEVTYPGTNFCTPAVCYTRTGVNAGAYFVSSFNAPAGAEFNVNLSAAFFPYNKWTGGMARNSAGTTGATNNLFTGSPGLVLGTHFVDKGGGISVVNLTSLGIDSRTNGVLLVMHAGNEDNYALSQVNTTNGTWTVYVKDNGTDAATYEQDPVAFVFIPKTNTSVISGRFQGDGTRLLFSGASPAFSVTNIATGTWRLTIPGHSPTSGVLIISPDGGLSQNQDNIVSYQSDGDGWIIQARDLPTDPPALQTALTQPIASFVFIPAAATLTLISPANNATNLGASPNLQVVVSNTTSTNLTIEFFGRATDDPGPDFTLVAFPDTQYYSAERFGGLKEMFYAQTEWVISNRVPYNIAYVAHLGDISDSGDIKSGSPNTTEWRNSTNAMYRMESPTRTLLQFGIPYGTAVGNHDQEPNGDADGTTTFFNLYFGVSHFTGRPYYAGHYGTNNDNHFDFFSAGGLDFVVLYFEYDTNATPAVLAWGNEVLRTNADRRAIIVTHNFGNTSTPLTFSKQGAAIYNALKTNSNVFLMLAGHVTGEGSRVDTFNGNTIRTFVSDYQGWTNGGNGLMRLMEFSPQRNQVVVQTYSPWTGAYETNTESEFFFNYDMQKSASPFELIATRSNVSPSAIVSTGWPNRQPDTTYEWYAVVTDSSGNTTTGPLWRFSTGNNSPPVATNQSFTVTGDAPTNLTLVAFDPNGDHLVFSTNSFPSRGLNSNFNPDAGTVTYQPARGFRGVDQFSFHVSDSSRTSTVVNVTLNVISPPDTNGNGLPDAWEAKYGVTNPSADNDGDGHSNLQEYFANTNPTNAASVLRISAAARDQNGRITLQWPSVGSTRYRIQYSNGLTNGSINAPFIDIVRPLSLEMDPSPVDTPSTRTFLDDFTLTVAPTNRARYYRLKVVP
ncbi:MAG: phosphohydrolase [Verrucomicrobiales bacterium]|nr:phosphohydrolase [Verrucomicrobiales bacterium]